MIRAPQPFLKITSAWLTLTVLSTVLAGCASSRRWVNAPFRQTHNGKDHGVRIYDPNTPQQATPQATTRIVERNAQQQSDATASAQASESDDGPRPQLKMKGSPQGQARGFTAPKDGKLLGVFRNTYYDFPAEFTFADSSSSKVVVMDRSCKPIAEVAREFYESLCVQGSGTLLSGRTVSFSKRDCSCAEVCPRTDQKICFDALDQSEFPWGRGALGKAITPLLTIAVDSNELPLGTHVYIPEFDGVERHPGGGKHNGCFIAEDRGMKVVGKHVDIFSGNPSITAHLNALVPSNQGVHVYVDTERCR